MPQALPLPDKIAPDSALTTKARTLVAQFGDGYSQRVADGINAKVDEWQISWWNLSSANAATVRAALDAVGGWDYLTYTPYKESVQKKFIVVDGAYQVSFNAGYATIRATLRQVFDV